MKTKFVSKYGTTGNYFKTAQPKFKPPAKIGGGTTADDGSTQQAEQQIAASPLPFQNPRAAANLPAPVNRSRLVNNPHGSSAGGTRPRANTAAAPRSDPPPHNVMMQATGHPPGYAPKQGYSPTISGRLKPGRTRVMRGAVPGSRPFVKPMDDSAFAEGAALYRKENGRI